MAAENSAVHRGRSGQTFVLRASASVDDAEQCLALQQTTWGYPDREVVPRNIFVLAQSLGGHILTAWDEAGRLAGYAMGLAAHEPANPLAPGRWMRPVGTGNTDLSAAPEPVPYLHSHQVAIAAAYQSEGLGFALKACQREEALSRGLRLMRWTFDPTMARNAYFNLHRLRATVRLYVPNFYGLNGSKLQGGLPTDRLLAEWPLLHERTAAAVERRSIAPDDVVQRIALPERIAQAKAAGELGLAVQLQGQLRQQLQAALQAGLEVCGFESHGLGGEYLLRPCANPLPQIDEAAHEDNARSFGEEAQ